MAEKLLGVIVQRKAMLEAQLRRGRARTEVNFDGTGSFRCALTGSSPSRASKTADALWRELLVHANCSEKLTATIAILLRKPQCAVSAALLKADVGAKNQEKGFVRIHALGEEG